MGGALQGAWQEGAGRGARGGAWRFVPQPSLLQAPSVPVTRLHRAAAGRAHPAAAVRGCSKGEAGRGEQRTESPRAPPGEAGEVEGRGKGGCAKSAWGACLRFWWLARLGERVSGLSAFGC